MTDDHNPQAGMEKMQLDVYMATGQHYQVIITLDEVHDIRRMWRAAIRGEGTKHTLYLRDRLENQVAEVRLIYIASVNHRPAPPEASGESSELRYN